jgi:16S rRNA (uracil1498-N3)-methyltransferase
MRNVLRLLPGFEVRAFDGSGQEFVVELTEVGHSASGVVREILNPSTEPSIRLTLVQGLPKGEKTDFIFQKCTEIGVSEFILTETARSVARIPADRLEGRLERWRSIVREAAEQSGRVRLPEVGLKSFKEAMKLPHGVGIIAWEGERETTLSQVIVRLKTEEHITLFVGPEGGFTEEEIADARTAGIQPVSLGPRILRTETAAVVASALIIYD